MKYIKTVLGHLYFFVGMLLFVISMLIVFIPIWLVSFLNEPLRSKLLHTIFKVWMGVFMPIVGCPIIRRGKEHFKKGENYIVVINHNSLVDIPVSSPWIPGPNKTLAKAEMAKIPIFGVIYKAGSVLVNRKHEGSRRESFTKMQEMLDMGLHLCLYPEGTRNKTNMPLQQFFDGAFITAIKSQRPIIPGLIFNTGKILPHDKKLWARPMPIYFHFLEPIPTVGMSINDVGSLKQRVHKIMEDYYVSHLNNK